MPIYEYRCNSGHQYERTEGFDAPTEHPCPHCGGPARRRFSTPAVIFKGSGFYSTDNRKGWTPASDSGGAKTEAPASASTSSTESDAKAEVKSEG